MPSLKPKPMSSEPANNSSAVSKPNQALSNPMEWFLQAGQMPQLDQVALFNQMFTQVTNIKLDYDAYTVQLIRKNFVGEMKVFFNQMISFQHDISRPLLLRHGAKFDQVWLASNWMYCHNNKFSGTRESTQQLAKYAKIPSNFLIDHSRIRSFQTTGKTFSFFLHDKLVAEWNGHLSDNPYLDWAYLLNSNHRKWLNWDKLYENQGIPWSEEILKMEPHKTKERLAILYKNPSLPWDKQWLLDVLVELYPDHRLAIKRVFNTYARSLSALAAQRNDDWSVELIREHADRLDWQILSANPSLPFTMELLLEFKDKWIWSILALNPGVYEKVFRPILNDEVLDDLYKLAF